MSIRPEIKEQKIYDIFGGEKKVIVSANSSMTIQKISETYTNKFTELKEKRDKEELDSKMLDLAKATKIKKDDMVEEMLIYKDSDIQAEASNIVDNDSPNLKEEKEKLIKTLKDDEREELKKLSIDELRKLYVTTKLDYMDLAQVLDEVYKVAVLYNTRQADDFCKKVFSGMEDLMENYEPDTIQFLMKEHLRVNGDRGEEEAKN